MRIIDAHCHIGEGITYSHSAEELLGKMDANGVSAAGPYEFSFRRNSMGSRTA